MTDVTAANSSILNSSTQFTYYLMRPVLLLYLWLELIIVLSNSVCLLAWFLNTKC